jgi:hypothetical protein
MMIPSTAFRRLAPGLLALLLTGCGTDSNAPAPGTARPTGPYFDVRGLLDQQVEQLAAHRPAVLKTVSLHAGPPETVRVAEVKWAEELQLFFQADINKAALRGAYALDSVALPGGLIRRTYTRKTELANAPVSQLTVVQDGTGAREISATIIQKNPLFTAHKQLHMELQQGQLRRYRVQGTQKLILFDTLHYSAAGQIVN